MVWRFRDGKAGHERQTAGLLSALAARRVLLTREIAASDVPHAFVCWLRGRWPGPPPAERPDLILGAGRACQWPMLAARRALGGHTVYCMKPGLPSFLFDLCLVPEHDQPRRGVRVEPTLGVLNDLTPGSPGWREQTVILVGGPSRHHGWDSQQLLTQISAVLARSAGPVMISDSRRTPAATRAALAGLANEKVRFMAAAGLPMNWLPDTLRAAHTVWVSSDSVSMIFEALTTGAPVGVLHVPARREDRITRLIDRLIGDGRVLAFEDWRNGRQADPAPTPLAEAARCAELILERWG